MTDETKIIKGSGGGPKQPPPPYRAPDTLHSRQFVTVQDLISEGEIEGFASASKEGLTRNTTAYTNASLKDVFLDDTPVLAPDANSANPSIEKFNFNDVTFKYKFGEGNQTAMSGIPAESRRPVAVNVEVKNEDSSTIWKAVDDGAGNLTGRNYAVNDIVRSANDEVASKVIVFKCTTAGQAGTTEPAAFLTATVGQTITDGGVTWTAQTVGSAGAITRQITNTDVTAVIVTLTWPQIQVMEDDGDIRGDSVEYAIQIQHDSGGFVTKVLSVVSGRTADAYSRDHRIELTSGFTTVDIKVVRIGATSTDTQRQNLFRFTSFQEVIDNNSTYPNSAYLALRLDSKQFSRVPTRKYRIRGIKVKIPGAGANVVSANYTQNDGATPPAAGTIITITNNNHGLSVGELVKFTATSGNGGTGTFVIQTVSTDGNSFTLTAASSQNITTSTCTFTVIPRVDIQTGRIIYPNGYIFNGVMGAAVYTNCPAMCLLDLLTNTRYGLGDHVTESNLDLFSFVAASKYANEEVDAGDVSGTKEARFSCNVNIQSPKEAFEAINELSGVMRCMPIWSAGSVTISQDRPTTASYLFNLANVGEGGFNYSGSSLKTRHTVVSVSYFNMDSKEIDFEVVEDATAIAKFGTILKQIKAFACTSRNQAARLGRAVLFAEQHESEVVTFSTSIDSGVVVRPGSVIEIADPVRAGARRGGRVVSATNTAITIDANAQTTTPALNDNPTISVILPNGKVEVGKIGVITNGVLTLENSSDAVSKVNDQGEVVTQATFSDAPLTNSPYLLSSTTLQTQLFRVIQVEEQDDVNYVITALSYVNDKYDFIENGTALPERKISLLNEPVNPPTNLVGQEQTVIINGVARTKLILSWKEPVEIVDAIEDQTNAGTTIEKPQGVSQYQLSYRFDGGSGATDNFITQIVFGTDFEIMDTKKGFYDIQVFSYNPTLKLSNSALSGRIPTEGKTARPENVSNLRIEPIDEQFVRLRFDQSTDADVLHGGRVYIRHTNLTGNSATFQSAQDVIQAVAGSATEAIVPALPGTYVLKFQDDGGRFSAAAANANLSLVDILDSIIVKTDREDTDSDSNNNLLPFNNTVSALFNRTEYSSVRGGLILSNPTTVISGTYTQVSSNTITCNITSHGLVVGETFNFIFATGEAKNKKYSVVSVTNANEFTILSSKKVTTSGNVSVRKGMNGTYNFNDILDLGGVFTLKLKRHFQGAGFFPSALWDDRVGLVDDFPDWDGDAADSANAVVAVRTTTASPSGSSYATSDFTNIDFNTFTNGTFKGRAFQFQTTLETNDQGQNIVLQQLGYSAEMPTRTEQSGVLFSDSEATGDGSGTAGARTVTFAAPFFVGTSSITGIPKPSVNISPQNMATGDFFELSSISGTGFIVHFKNSSGASIIRQFTYSAVGFGKGG